MAFGDSQLASAAHSAETCIDRSEWRYWLSLKAIVDFKFFLFLHFLVKELVDQNIKKWETSSSKGIR